MRILLTGGTGLIGQALCARWAAQGHELWVWSRQPDRVPALCSGARGVARLTDVAADALPDAVVNLAGAPIADRPWTQARRKLLWVSRVDLTDTLVQWMAQWPRPPKVLLSTSATGWYGDRGEQALDEDSPAGNTDFGSTLCMAWETAAQRAQALGVRVVVLRTAPVLSPQGGMLARMRPPFSLGLGGRLGNGQQWMPWIHMDDEVGLFDYLLQHEECQGVFNACAPGLVRNADFTQALAAALHRPAVLPAPAWALRAALGEMAVLLLGSQRVQPRRTLDAGYEFQYPHVQAALQQVMR